MGDGSNLKARSNFMCTSKLPFFAPSSLADYVSAAKICEKATDDEAKGGRFHRHCRITAAQKRSGTEGRRYMYRVTKQLVTNLPLIPKKVAF